MKHYGDITKINGAEVEPVDVIVGGSPCQDLSVAGKRAGLEGERSGLFMEQVRIVKEMREHEKRIGRSDDLIRPRYLVWENVEGAFSSGTPKGADFAAVLEEIIKVIEPETPHILVPDKGWSKAGCIYDDMGRWSVAWRVHNGQYWGPTVFNADGSVRRYGTPQRRKRIALVADFGGLTAPEVLFERKGMSWHPQQSREEGEGPSESS